MAVAESGSGPVDRLIHQLLSVKGALQSGRVDSFGWVLPKATYDQLRDYARTQAERSGATWADGVTLLGMHVRSDEHATTIMLEPR